jgi:hypothetical protein
MTIKFLKHHDVPYYPASNAEFFVWVDLGAAVQRRMVAKNGMALKDFGLDDSDSNGYTETTADIMSKLLAQKVFLASGEVFGSERPGWFLDCLLLAEGVLGKWTGEDVKSDRTLLNAVCYGK